MPGLDWLTARPVAHRGLHDASAGVIENSASAFTAAVAGGYAIECDLQISADGEAMVHHDAALGRLTEGDGRLAALSAAAIAAAPFRKTADRILTLGELCALVAGRTPLLIELKSHWDGDNRLVARTAAVLASYAGPVAVMSFDPGMIETLRATAPGLPRGIVAERHHRHEGKDVPAALNRRLAHLLHAHRTRPHFVAYHVKDLPAPAPAIARWIFGLPLLAWTVRSDADRAIARRWADQVIFEGWRP
ncbi:MAG: glycerophosphodiester phosphodiesterase family protein [Pseudolabrys sp.]